MNLKLGVKLGQQLNVSPKLQQSIKMMQLSRQELVTAIENALVENPVLALNSDSSNTFNSVEPATEKKSEKYEEIQYEKNHFESTQNKNFAKDQHNSWLENIAAAEDPLVALVVEQLDLSQLPASTKSVLAYVLGNLDEQGFITESKAEIAAACTISLAEVEDAFNILKDLEPVGIGARNVQECLLIQLDNLGLAEGLAANIVTKHLERVAQKRITEIASLEKVPVVEVNQAVSIIKALRPIPGNIRSSETISYAIPDVYFEYDNKTAEFRVILNDDGIPRIKISNEYQKLAEAGNSQNDDIKYLRAKVADANWLLRSIEQRKITLRKVSEELCKIQKEFLLNGRDYLKPLTMKDLAAKIGVHESTVSRIANQKFAQTPQGLVELKFFFCQALSAGNEEMSAVAAKKIIASILQSEPKQKPISDQDLAAILKRGHNLEISRRTVAKYREELGIPASHLRKKIWVESRQ